MDLESARKNLASTDIDLVITSLRIIGSQGKLSDLQQIMPIIRHPDASIKNAAIQATSSLIKENLIAHFNELEPAIREKLGILLHSLDPLVVNDISEDLYAESDERRLRAVQILGLLKNNPQLREVLAKLIHNRDVKIRATAVNLLGKIIGPNDHDIILSLLNDKDKRVRANTIEALESLNNKRIIPILLRFRKDPNNRIRGNVVKALFNLGFAEIEQDIYEMLNSNDQLMKASALWVASKVNIRGKAIEDAAGFCLLSENEIVVGNACNALKSFNSPRAKGYLKYLVITENMTC